jgi:class 3 adenylate cyclase
MSVESGVVAHAARRETGPGDPFLRRELHGPVLVLARGLGLVFAVLALIMYARWLPRWLDLRLAVARHAASLSGGSSFYPEIAFAAAVAAIVAALAWGVLAGFVFWRRSRDLFGIVIAVGFLSVGIMFTDINVIVAMMRSDSWAPWSLAVILLANAFSMPWLYVFPNGRWVPRWAIALAAIWFAWSIGRILGTSLDQAKLGPPAIALNALLVSSGIASVAYRYWRRSDAVQRQQIKWALLGGLVFLAAYLLVIPLRALAPAIDHSPGDFLFRTASSAFLSLSLIAIPIALGIAIFRQGLFDINLIINRALAYGALTAILALGFVAISWAADQVLKATTGQRSNLVLLASVVPVTAAFVPVRARALRVADRFVADRTVITLLFLDLVGSTELLYALGDESWRKLLGRFRTAVRRSLKRYGGREIDTAGDGFFITFEAPERALRCARTIVETIRDLDLEVRIGTHIGEVHVDGQHVTGGAVHIASRVMSLAGPGEVLVSRPLRDVVAGSDIELADRGIHRLKGVPGEFQLYAASTGSSA